MVVNMERKTNTQKIHKIELKEKLIPNSKSLIQNLLSETELYLLRLVEKRVITSFRA